MPTTRIEIENANGKWVANVEVGGIAARRYAGSKPTFIEALKFVWDTIRERQPEAIGNAKTPGVLQSAGSVPTAVVPPPPSPEEAFASFKRAFPNATVIFHEADCSSANGGECDCGAASTAKPGVLSGGAAKIDGAPAKPEKQTDTSGGRSKAQRTFAAPPAEGGAKTE